MANEQQYRDDVEIVADGDDAHEVYYLVGREGRIYDEPFGSFSKAVEVYCQLTGEDPDMIDSAHRRFEEGD